MKHSFILPLQVYPFDILFSIGQTDAELLVLLSKYGLDEYIDEFTLSKTVRGRTVMLPSNQTVIRLKSNYDIGVLCHEVFHAVSFILSKVGIPLEVMKSDEAYAYLIEYVINCFIKEVKRR